MSKWVFADSDGITFLANISTQLAAQRQPSHTLKFSHFHQIIGILLQMFMSESIKGFQEEFENSTQSEILHVSYFSKDLGILPLLKSAYISSFFHLFKFQQMAKIKGMKKVSVYSSS